MIPKSCLSKLGDYRNNDTAEKQKNNTSFMVAWLELLQIIEFLENTPPNSQQLQQKTEINDPVRSTIPCRVLLRRLTIEQLKLMDAEPSTTQSTQSLLNIDNVGVAAQCRADQLATPCHVILWRLPIEQLKLIKTVPTTAPIENTMSKQTSTAISSEIRTKKLPHKNQIMKTNDSVIGGPLRPKAEPDADKKTHQKLPPKMVTRSGNKNKQTIAIKKNKSVRNKENL